MKHGKKYVDAVKLIDKTKAYDSKEAIDVCLKTATAKFDETVELHVKLGVDSRHADQQVRGAIVLPNGTGKQVRVLAICKGDNVQKAQEAGAEYVGAEEFTQKIQSEGWMDFDVLITTPDMMGLVGRLGKILGPRGLMPNPKAGTVTPDIARAVREAKAGKIEYRLDKTNIIHCPIGKVSFGTDKIAENFDALVAAIIKAKPAAAKGQYIKSCAVTTTMGPSVTRAAANGTPISTLRRLTTITHSMPKTFCCRLRTYIFPSRRCSTRIRTLCLSSPATAEARRRLTCSVHFSTPFTARKEFTLTRLQRLTR